MYNSPDRRVTAAHAIAQSQRLHGEKAPFQMNISMIQTTQQNESEHEWDSAAESVAPL